MLFKIKIVGEVKVSPEIYRNDWRWRKSVPAGVHVIAVRKDIEAGTFDVTRDFAIRGYEPYLMGDPEEHRVYDTYAEALRAARRITAACEADPVNA